MRVLLVNPRMSASSQPPLGLAYIAAYLKSNGYPSVSIIDTTWEDLDERLDMLSDIPDVVGIQIMTPYCTRAITAAEKIRARFPNVRLIVGGPHPTADPQHTLDAINPDFGVIGEGEVTFLQLVQALESGRGADQVNGSFYRSAGGALVTNSARDFIADLDEIPFPDRKSLPMDFYLRRGIMQEFGFKALRATTILTSRGCPHRCIYCSRLLGRKVRHRSWENTLEEIDLLVGEYGIDGLFIVDDTFTVNRRWTTEFCEQLQRRDYRLEIAINSRVDAITPDFLKILKAAGVSSVAFGVESGDQEILNTLKKGIRLEQVEEAVRYTREAGIKVKGYFMVGAPGETLQTMRKSVEFARKLPFNQVQFSIVTPYPGTELWDIANEGHLVKDFGEALDKGFSQSGVMSTGTLSPEEIWRFYQRECRPLVYGKILGSVLRDWKTIPHFATYVLRRARYRRGHGAVAQSPLKRAGTTLFALWLAFFIGLLAITAVYEGESSALLGVAGLLAYGALFGLFWLVRTRIANRLKLNSARLSAFLLTGWLAALVAELLLYFTLSYQNDIGLALDIAYTTPTYLGLLLGWWLMLKRHSMTYREVLFIGGFHGLLIEMPQKLLSGQNALEIVIGAPVHVALYGSILLVPAVLLGMGNREVSDTSRAKYLYALTVVPLIVLAGFALSIAILVLGQTVPS